MMSKLKILMTLVVGLGALTLLHTAKADEWNQKTVFTFSGPVAIPGHVLPAGTYVFKLASSHANRHIVQVFNETEDHVFGTFLAIPDYHLRPASKPIIKFLERPAGSPDAIKAWFYPGRHYGHEFVYPKTEAIALAKANNTPVPVMLAELMPDTTRSDITMDGPEVMALIAAPLKAEKPTGEEAELSEAFVATEPSAPPRELPERLPATATSMPLVALIGLLSLGGAFSLRLVAARVK